MRLVLRLMAGSALIVMAYATELSAQSGFANMVDHLHLAAPDPIKAAEWYRKNLGGRATTEGRDRLMFGETRIIFQRNEKPTPSAGSVLDHIGFSVNDVDATMKAMEADGAKIEGPAREVPGLFKLGFVVDPFGTRLEIVQDPEKLGLHHVHLRGPDPNASLAWYVDKFGGKTGKMKDRLDGINYGGVWLLAAKGEATPSAGHAIDHIGFRPLNVDNAVAALKTKNVKVTTEPRPLTLPSGVSMRLAFIEGIDGVRIELVQRDVSAQPLPTKVDDLLGAAKNAAGLDWPGSFLRLCIPPPPAAPAPADARGGARGTPPAPPPRETWYAEPAKVADNLYFLGTKIHNAWAIVGTEGIIVLEALYDYAAQDEIFGGMRKLGLDSRRVKYVILSHAHADHDGGAKLLQDEIPGVHLVYGAEDWEAVDKSTNHAGGKPKHDMAGTDGMKISVGDASVQIVTMPGHTPGTLSFLFEVRDNGKPLRIAYVGGTAIPFDANAEYYDGYIASSKKMAKAAADYGATALMSNHSEFDNAYFKAHAGANRKAGAANPFDVGAAAVARYFTVVQDCATAARIRATGK
jgi:metallo-beta-lactamase class B